MLADCQEIREELGLPAVPDHSLFIANQCNFSFLSDHDEDGHMDDGVTTCDPHVWWDPANVMLWTISIRDTLMEHLPEYGDIFTENAEAYLAQLRDLDGQLNEILSDVPEPRLIITLHDFLGYFVDRYDFEQDNVLQNFSSIAAPNPADLATLIDRLTEMGVRAIFGEEPLDHRVMEQIADELGIPLVSIYGGTLSDTDGPAANYIDYMLENARRISSALSGNESE